MTIAITVNGKKTVVPGVYSTFEVDDSLNNVAAGARNIVLIGEADKGAPGSELDLRGVYFNSFDDLRDYYGTGPLTDAARMLYSNQPDPLLAGSVGRVYCYKTNNSGLATSNIYKGSTVYSVLNSAEYGLNGNLINYQVKSSTTEIKPEVEIAWSPVNTSSDFNVRINGCAEQTITVGAEATPTAVAAAVDGITGLVGSGGAGLELFSSAQVTAADEIDVAVSGHTATLTIHLTGGGAASTFDGADVANLREGDLLYIPAGSAIKGGTDANVGSYKITSVSISEIVMEKLDTTAPEAVTNAALSGDQTLMAEAELVGYTPITITVDAETPSGVGASLEIYATGGDKSINNRFFNWADFDKPISEATAALANMSLEVTNNVGVFTITTGSFLNVPAVGDVLWVLPDSKLAGASKENVGAWTVTMAGSTSITATKATNGGASVASVALVGEDNPFYVQPGIATVGVGVLHTSSAEQQVYLSARRETDSQVFPETKVGGRNIIAISYTGSEEATLSISNNKILTTVCTNTDHNLRVVLARYTTVSDLVSFLNSKNGYSAKVISSAFNAFSPSNLDQVQDICIGGGVDNLPAYNGRIKADYYDFFNLLESNEVFLTMDTSVALIYKAGLPDIMDNKVFLNGGTAGFTTDSDVTSGFDAAMKVPAVLVEPLFSRDASKDIADGLTDESSSYTIDAIVEAAKAHVNTATASYKERSSILGYHSDFETVKFKARNLFDARIQMCFQMVKVLDGEGNLRWFQPWMQAIAFAAARVQSDLGTPLLRRSFLFNDIKHIGDKSIYDDTLVRDFDEENELADAIEAGLLVVKSVQGAGIRMESPDTTTRSSENDPKAWTYERASVLFVSDQVVSTCRTVLDNYIGRRGTSVSAAVVQNALARTLSSFVKNGALLDFKITKVDSLGNGYIAKVAIFPVEAVEFIQLDVVAQRAV